MSWSRILFACLGALLVTACDDATDYGGTYPFLRPEHLEFACFAPQTANPDAFDVLPRACCADVVDRMLCPVAQTDGRAAPRLHALVSQTIRGEIAAADLTVSQRDRVLDSDRAVPGFTFIDSGGLPSGLVVPPRHPRADQLLGPQWIYTASAEQYEVRAIATCRFRSGVICGPERALMPAGQTSLDAIRERLVVPLPSAPGDLLLGPDDALWATLPELGLLARIALAEPGVDAAGAPVVSDAFVIDAATGRPVLPQFFRVPTPAAAEPPAPVTEAELYESQSDEGLQVYQKVCGLGIATDENAAPPKLPIAPRVRATTAIRPTRMHLDEASGTLLVGDVQAPFIHAFSLDANGVLTSLGALPTGAPTRDFAVTPVLPTRVAERVVPPPEPPPDFQLAEPEDQSTQTRRYLYAIDHRDGSLMLFDFKAEPGSIRILPLLAPSSNLRFADRLDEPQPLTALEVIDTRVRSPSVCGEYGTKATIQAREAELIKLREAPTTTDAQRAAIDRELQVLAATLEIYEEVGPLSLRGVFVMGAAARGTLTVVDLHDLDLACRVEEQCGTPDETVALNPADRAGVALRRHTLRRRYAGSLEISLPNPELLVPKECPAGYVAPPPGTLACVSRDPWNMISETWSADYQGPIPGTRSPSGVFEPTADPAELVLRGPAGLNFCGRGALPGDFVAVMDLDAREIPAGCVDLTSAENETLLTVIEARGDQLLVREREPNVAARLLGCFPDLVSFEVRAKDFLVTGASGLYFHNVASDAEGRCTIDLAEDPKLSARAVPGEPFTSPYISFQLSDQGGGTAPRTVSVQVTQGTQAISSTVVQVDSGDALPAAIRYVPEVGDVFVLDGTSQGLLRYNLTPLEREDDN